MGFIQQIIGVKTVKHNFIVAFDVDDTVLDLVPVWLDYHNYVNGDSVKVSDIKSWDIASYTNLRNTPKRFYDLLNSSMYENIMPIPGAIAGIELIRKVARTIFVTSNFGDIGKAKFDRLNSLGLDVSRKDFFEASDKSLIVSDFLLDDNYDNVMSAYGMGILFTREWNKKDVYNPRVNNWDDAVSFILKEIEAL